jgi:hypothetical protein
MIVHKRENREIVSLIGIGIQQKEVIPIGLKLFEELSSN